ncbi:alpha-amylase family glycosyl hydrolase [Ornithinimicrobium pekingense]|uniref:Glycosidase n=1 Tax=Ornithinimicrobium pekingense TaxID=384677 RepID=A0ABQ2FBF0_9MICO|nr:alpha-amylase family glycosyl hydrolase [Ornithinimicrobium pekingense]GGK72582.1 glycosidase [Ornithinimicrobium pekingense]
MGWADHVIWWHCYPLGFVGAEPTAADDEPVRHRLGRLTGWLDHVVRLGANGLLLGPVFASRTHGYDTLDHLRVDPRLGDDRDLDELLREARARGVRVCLDGVFNHVSRDHPVVQRALAAGPDSEEGRWLRWSEGYPLCFEGHLDLVELDLTHPPVADHVVEVMTHWLSRGVDAWRLDAAYAPGAQSWRGIVERVRAAYPQVWILAEVIHGPYEDFVAASGVDSVTQYELWKSVWSSLNDRNLHELAWTVGRHADLCRAFVPQTFVGNHDVTRIATRLHDERHLPLAVALLMLLPGVPSVYAGDEFGMTGTKHDRPGGDDEIRPRFPAGPDELDGRGQEVLDTHRHLVSLRRRHPWLTRAQVSVTEVTGTRIALLLSAGDERLTLTLDAGEDGREPGWWTDEER